MKEYLKSTFLGHPVGHIEQTKGDSLKHLQFSPAVQWFLLIQVFNLSTHVVLSASAAIGNLLIKLINSKVKSYSI